MRREPVTVEGLGALYCSNIKLSTRLRWIEQVEKDPHISIPSLLSIAVVNEAGESVKTVDEWDEWAAENQTEAMQLWKQCAEVIGTDEAAAKK